MALLSQAIQLQNGQVFAASLKVDFQCQLRAGLPRTSAQGLAQGGPRGHRDRGSKRGRRLAGDSAEWTSLGVLPPNHVCRRNLLYHSVRHRRASSAPCHGREAGFPAAIARIRPGEKARIRCPVEKRREGYAAPPDPRVSACGDPASDSYGQRVRRSRSRPVVSRSHGRMMTNSPARMPVKRWRLPSPPHVGDGTAGLPQRADQGQAGPARFREPKSGRNSAPPRPVDHDRPTEAPTPRPPPI